MSVPPDSRSRPPIGAVVLLCAALVAVLAVAFLGGDDEGDVAAPPVDQVATTLGGTDGGDAECVNVHAGHAVSMWSATMADEMTAAGCGWPYDPFTPSLEGGQEDSSLAAPFEARLYDELWQMVSAMPVGTCQVGRIADWPADGFVFGFAYTIGPPGCPADSDTVVMSTAEHATRALRDASAHAVSGAGDPTFVLGRWVITLGGSGDPQPIADGLQSLGAVPVSS